MCGDHPREEAEEDGIMKFSQNFFFFAAESPMPVIHGNMDLNHVRPVFP